MTPHNQQAEEHFYELIRQFGTAMLVTRSVQDGTLRARPMAVANVGSDAALWFITSIESPKIDEIAHERKLLVVMQSSDKYLSVSGYAEFNRDRVKIDELWSESFRVWFAQGKEDPEIVLIRVDPVQAEYWDNSGSKGLSFLFKAAKAYLSGEELRDPGNVESHAKVAL